MAFLFFFYNSKLGPHLLPLRVPHRHIRFCLFHESSNMAHEIHFPTEFSSNPNQTHPSMLINFFRIFRKPQVGELDQGWSWSLQRICPPFQDSRNPDLFIYEWKKKD